MKSPGSYQLPGLSDGRFSPKNQMNQSSADGDNIPVHVANLNKARGSAPALAGPGLEPGTATVAAVHTGATGAPYDRDHWLLERLPLLEGIAPLLPGAPDKRPIVGDGWPDHLGLTISQLQAAAPECVCWHVGAAPGHVAIDIDGPKAAAFCASHGCNPYEADTWQIIRTGNDERLKLVFTVTHEQKAALAAGGKTVKIEGQELAVFAKPGTQIVVLGQHFSKESGFTENDDQYAWAGRAPADAQPLPPEWFELLTGVFCGDRPLRPPTRRTVSPASKRGPHAYRSGCGVWVNSSQRHPCPMCGRDHSGACSIHRDGDSVWCCHGETKSAPDCSKPGQTETGHDGRTWAYIRTENHDSFGERSLFKIDQPQQGQQAAAAPAAPQQRRPLTMAEVGERLREAVSEGMGGADLAALVAELATASEQGSISVQRLADAIRTEQLQAVAVAAEAQQIAAERDRQEIGQLLSAHYLLPAGIAAAIETRARYLPCDGPSAVLPFLATVAGLVKLGTEVEGSAPAGYSVPVNLFACLVGRSGAKKSPVGRLLVEAPTADLRAELARANQRDREAWEEQCRDLKKGDAKPPAPHPKRLSVSDFTAEALAAQLQTQESAGLGLLVHRDELSGLFGSLNAYRGGRGADEQQLLELFDGSGLSSLRIVGDRHYSRSQVSIWGSTQPEVLRQLVADGDASGLWARFLFVPLPERAVPLPLATSAAEVGEVEAAAATLANACRAVYRLPRQTYRLAPAAAERFAHYELNRQRAALGATIGAQSALYGKSAGKVLRLAGVLHLLQIAAGELAASSEIEPGTIERAAALVDHLDAWALSLHAEVAAGGVGQAMRTVHRAAEAAAEAIRWKDLAVRLSAKQRKEIDAATFKEAAAALAAGGYGEVEAGKRGAISYRATRALP
jgi:hypothetical protein